MRFGLVIQSEIEKKLHKSCATSRLLKYSMYVLWVYKKRLIGNGELEICVNAGKRYENPRNQMCEGKR